MKKFLLLLLTLLALAACGSKKDVASDSQGTSKIDPNKPGWEQDTDKVNFDWYINYSWYAGKWGQDTVTKEITEKTGVSVNYIIPTGDGTEKLNTMIASGTLPDLITLDARDPIIETMIKGNLLLPYNKLAEQYDMYFFKVADPDRLNWFKKEDGNTYAYPNASYTTKNYKESNKIISNNTFLVRKDIYEAIGKPDMSTPEGFLNALKLAKEKFPTINGQPISPLAFQEALDVTLTDYLQDFLAVPYEKDGKVNDKFLDPDYVAWLKTLRKAYNEKLISADVFVDKRPQIEEKMTQGRYFAMMYPYIDALRPLSVRFKEDPNSNYIAVDGPKNARGDKHTLAGPGISGWTVTLISKNNKNPQKAIRFLTYMMSEEGQRTVLLGKKGVTWDVIDGKEQLLPDIAKMRTENRKEFDQVHGADDMHWMLMDNAMQRKNWAVPSPAHQVQIEEWTYDKVQPRFIFEMIDPQGNIPEAVINEKVKMKLPKVLASLVTAKSDAEFDKIYNAFIEERKSLGFDKVIEYKTTKMKENKAKLGL